MSTSTHFVQYEEYSLQVRSSLLQAIRQQLSKLIIGFIKGRPKLFSIIRSAGIAVLFTTLLFAHHASAVTVTDSDGNFYDVVAITGTFFTIGDILKSQPWWGATSSIGSSLAIDLGEQLGTPNLGDTGAPGFARFEDTSNVYAHYFFPAGPFVQQPPINKGTEFTFAIVDTTPVPIPPAVLLFAAPLFGLAL